MTAQPGSAGHAPWRHSRAHGRAAAVGVGALVIGVLVHRPDLALLGVPLALVALWGALAKPGAQPRLSVDVAHDSLREGEATQWAATLEPVPGVAELSVALPERAFVDHRPGRRAGVAAADRRGEAIAVGAVCRFARWGPYTVGPAAVTASSPWGAYRWSPAVAPSEAVTVVPLPQRFTAHGPMPHPDGLVGPNRSHRPGDGSEMADIRPFRAGDRLRRVHWPVSLRTQQLHVTATYADQDTEVALLLDAVHDLGVSEGLGGLSSSLDGTVRAAGAIAEHFLARGERVSLTVLGAASAPHLSARTGRRHLMRLSGVLATVHPSHGTVADERHLSRALRGRVNAGAVVVVLTPLVSSDVLDHAINLSRHGHTVVVVDTLPPHLATSEVEATALRGVVPEGTEDDPRAALAWRLRLLERAREVRLAREAGVPVVAWRGPGTLDEVLADVNRRRRAPRLVAR
jgi:uncharacterized protein (DUF58 family)